MSKKRISYLSRYARRGLCALALFTVFQTTACHRGYYRRQADAEAVELITEKANDPHWALPDRSIDIDPRSRMYDPHSLDHAPMPKDDPSSAQFMRRVDGKPGFPHWDANGNTDFASNPEWEAFVPKNENGKLVLDVDRAVRVAYLHSPDYQSQRETLYLSALNVSAERFGFDAQLFSSYDSFLTHDGPIRGGGSSSTTLQSQTGARGLRLEKLGITGSTLVVGLANTLLWQFSGTDTNAATSLIDFSLVQPLLRGAGRERIMESLTQAERTLLANVRQMERFRRGFYLEVVTGRNAGAGPNLGGNFLGTPGSQQQGAGGIIGLLQDKENISIQEYNVSQLRSVLNQFRIKQKADQISLLQVNQVENQYYGAQGRLFQATTFYQNSLDNFKQTLGLPPEMEIEISDPLLGAFELVDKKAIKRQDQIAVLLDNVAKPVQKGLQLSSGKLLKRIETGKQDIGEDIQLGVNWDPELEEVLKVLLKELDKIDEVREGLIRESVPRVRADIKKLASIRSKRIEKLAKLRDLELDYGLLSDQENQILGNELVGEEAVEDPQNLQKSLDTAIANLSGAKQKETEAVRQKIKQLLRNHQDPVQTKTILDGGILRAIPELVTQISDNGLELLLIQVRARTDAIQLPDVNIDSRVALQIAKKFRRDWMNARASLVDSWRQIEFAADQLESTFDLVLEGDVGTVGDNPLDFRLNNGRLRAGFRFDSPLTRLNERNTYRQRIIEYQQARRSYYQVRDEIARNLRQIVRTINQSKILFELQRRQIKVNVEQVENARLRLQNPEGSNNPTAGRDLTDAINGLQNAQTDFLGEWVTFEVQRRGLDFDLGTMELDENSIWLDPGDIGEDFVIRVSEGDGEILSLLDEIESSKNTDPAPAPGSLDNLPPANRIDPATLQNEGALSFPGSGGSLFSSSAATKQKNNAVSSKSLVRPTGNSDVNRVFPKLKVAQDPLGPVNRPAIRSAEKSRSSSYDPRASRYGVIQKR